MPIGERKSESESAFEQVPEHLLPNYGVGSIRQYNLDLNMMMFNCIDRTVGGFVELGEIAGLEFVGLWGDLGFFLFILILNQIYCAEGLSPYVAHTVRTGV